MAGKQTDLVKLSRGRNILVVDDERFSRSLVQQHLKSIEFMNTVPAASVAEALEALLATPKSFCAVICDFNMPGLTGLHLLKSIRTGFGGIPHQMPAIMLTGFADANLVGGALRLDVDAFVVKPVSRNTLEMRLIRALANVHSIKPAESYASVDVDALANFVLRPEVVVVTKAPTVTTGVLLLDDLTEGAILTEDLNASSGELLLCKGFHLSSRMLSRLKELAEVGIVPHNIHARQPEENQGSSLGVGASAPL